MRWLFTERQGKCGYCQKDYERDRKERRFCSVDCSRKALPGRFNKKKNGAFISCTFCNKSVYKPRVHLLGSKNYYCSTKCIGLYRAGKPKPELSGENARNWKGGTKTLRRQIHTLYQYQNWRKQVFERDNYTCQGCSTRGGTLNADHIVPFSFLISELKITTKEDARYCEKLWDVSNGRTLCVPCHTQTDTWGSKVHHKTYELA